MMKGNRYIHTKPNSQVRNIALYNTIGLEIDSIFLFLILPLDDSKHISFQLSICNDQGQNENATHARGEDLVLQDLCRLPFYFF